MLVGCKVYEGYIHPSGYGLAYNPRTGKTAPAHVVAWEATCGLVPEGLELDHTCSNRACIEITHLEPVTHIENVHRGNRTKFTPDDIDMMRQLLSEDQSFYDIAKLYGTYANYVRRLVNGERGV